jgi:hypothetical protein
MQAQVLVGFGACLLVAALLVGKFGRSEFARRWGLLSVFVPTWRFFERLDASPDLLYRVWLRGSEPGPWLRVIPHPPRSLRSLIWNPEGNLTLASYGLVDQLVAELEEHGRLELAAAEQLVSYRLVRCLVEHFCPATLRASPDFGYQFKLVSLTSNGVLPAASEELLVSEVYAAV